MFRNINSIESDYSYEKMREGALRQEYRYNMISNSKKLKKLDYSSYGRNFENLKKHLKNLKRKNRYGSEASQNHNNGGVRTSIDSYAEELSISRGLNSSRLRLIHFEDEAGGNQKVKNSIETETKDKLLQTVINFKDPLSEIYNFGKKARLNTKKYRKKGRRIKLRQSRKRRTMSRVFDSFL